MSIADAIELGRRSIYHATFRDCASGGTVSGELALRCYFSRLLCYIATLHLSAQVAAACTLYCLFYVATWEQEGLWSESLCRQEAAGHLW
jgi:hypothetical protein